MEPQKMHQSTQQLQQHFISREREMLNPQLCQILYIKNVAALPQWMQPLTLENNPFGLELCWTHVQTLQAALHCLHAQSFDLIAVHLSLPDSQGLETFNTLQSVAPHLPIVVISATTAKEVNLARQCVQRGATDYWLQPMQESDILWAQELLVRTLQQIQERQQLQQQLKQSQTQLKEHQLFEQRLHTTQAQIQGVLEAINDIVLILDAAANDIDVIPTGLIISDQREIDLLNQTLNLFISEEQSQPILAAIARSLATQTSLDVEYSLTVNQQQLWFTAHISPLSEEQILWVARDITQRKQAEEQLRQSQQFLQLVIDNIPQHIFWKDCNSVYLGCNQNFAKVVGLETAEQIVGKTDDDLPSTQAESDRYRNDDRRVIANNQPEYHIIETQLTAEGQQVWLDTCKIPLHDQQGNVVGILGTHEDITNRRLTEEWLKLTQFTLDHAGDEIFLLNSQARLIYVNDAACQKLGYTREQLLQLTIDKIDPILTQRVWQKHWRKLKQKGSLTRESVHQTQQGREFPVEVSINYLKFNDQEYNCLIARDISDRRVAEEKLQQQFATIEAAIDGIALMKDNQYIYLNPAHVQLFGYDSPEELIGKSWTTLYSSAEIKGFKRDVFPILGEKQAWRGEAVGTRKDGSTFPEEVSLTLTSDGTLICVCRDITQRKQAELEMFKALETEQELNELKSRFITLMSHEFRTPLSVISSSAGILETFADQLSPQKKQKHIHKIQTQIQHTTKLLDEILLINQAETHQLTLNSQPLHLVDFCQTLVEEIQHSHGNPHPIELNYPQHDPLIALVDPTLLRHILTQLLSNAVKFSPNGGKISMSLTIMENQICFQVQDHGIGIPLANQKHLFQSFYRAQNVGNIQGTGLGLSIVKKCIDLYDGQITLESEVAQGTTFTVTLPLGLEEY